MYSRAHLLIRRDYERFLEHPPWGIEAYPLKEDNMFEWSARILGLKDTVWEGGIFRVYLKFNEHYNDRPPDVCFHTIPFHPNVDMITGKPCIDFLDDPQKWKAYSFSTLLLTIQAMLSNPVLEEAVNRDAINLMINTPHAFKQMIQDCVSASQRVEAGLSPHLDSYSSKSNINNELNRNHTAATSVPRNKVRLSFEDYHSTWKGIATSKVTPTSINPLLEEIKDNAERQAVHYGLPLEELEHQMERQIQEHTSLIYGKFDKPKPTIDQQKQNRMDQVSKMRKIYLQRRTPTSRQNTAVDEDMLGDMGAGLGPQEPWEKEVDDLVAWTNKLDVESL